MTLVVIDSKPDGTTIIRDNMDGQQFVLKPGQWPEVQALPHDQQRAKAEELHEANRLVDQRTELDEQTNETAANASSGEAHEQDEEARP
jgi:hypothetical protein